MPDLYHSPDPDKLDAVLHALADARRRDMIARLSRHPMTVSDLAKPLGMRLSSAVKHLAVLEFGGIVVSKKIGRRRTYRIKPDALDGLADWTDQRRAAMSAASDRPEQTIQECPEDGAE